ncbi:MAG: dihydroorotase [Flavitalea sp.]
MKFLIQQALIIDPLSSRNNSRMDILVENGTISSISESISPDDATIIGSESVSVSPGWVDIFSNFADPGYEFKETLETGANAAAAGGYTNVFVIPNTKPAVDSKAQVEYIRSRSGRLPVNIFPLGSISHNNEGKDLAEMYDMFASGAIAFTDGINPVQSSGILLKALQYVKAFDGVIIQIPDDKSVGATGVMNEGVISTRLGLPGKPIIAEELLIARDIKLARYAESKIHFTGVTSPKSLEYIRRAKDAGLQVTCSVSPYHLYFTEEDLMEYDSNLKVYPPLRSVAARNELRKALLDGTIDIVASHHMPHETDSKVVEFEYAKNGMIGLETCYNVIRASVPEISDLRIAELLSINPRKIFGLPALTIEVGEAADLTIFSTQGETLVDNNLLKSRSRNTPYLGMSLPGKVIGTVLGNSLHLNN